MKQFFTTMLIFSISFIFSSCNNAIKGYEWLEGNWEVNEKYFQATMNITKNKFTINCNDERYNIENSPINIGKAHNSYYGENGTDILALNIDNDAIAIDEEEKVIRILESEYTSYTLTKVEEPKDVELENEEPNKLKSEKEKKKKYKSSSNISKNLIDAFNKYEYIMFETNYRDSNLSQRPYYIVLHPFVYSEDASQGIIYFVCYGEDKYNSYRKGEVDAILNYYGEYEVFGDYIRVRDITQTRNKDKQIESLTYAILKNDNKLVLVGGFPTERTEKYSNRQIMNIPNLIIELLEKENVCRHN